MNSNFLLEESITHGNSLFPLCLYENTLSDNRRLFLHWHEEVEFIFLKKGKIFFQVGKEEKILSANSVLFINSRQLHSGFTSPNIISEYCALVFDLRMLYGGFYDICQEKYLDPFVINEGYYVNFMDKNDVFSKNIYNELLIIKEMYENKYFCYELNIKSCLIKIISNMLLYNLANHSQNRFDHGKDYRSDLLKDTITYIQNNYCKKISLKDLAKHVNMSMYNFCHFFKEYTGNTSTEYINRYRIDKATNLLIDQNRKILDISIDVGFENVSYFIKVFKKYKKCTPSEFRDNIK